MQAKHKTQTVKPAHAAGQTQQHHDSSSPLLTVLLTPAVLAFMAWVMWRRFWASLGHRTVTVVRKED